MESLDAVRRYFDAWTARDADAVLASLTDDGTYQDPTHRRPDFRRRAARLSRKPLVGLPRSRLRDEGARRDRPRSRRGRMADDRHQSRSLAGLPPTGRTVRLPGADFFTLRDGKVATVTGYFDSAGVPRQVGLDVIVQPSQIGPFRFGVSTMVQTGRTDLPGAFSITALQARDPAARAGQFARTPATPCATCLPWKGSSAPPPPPSVSPMITVSAWDSPGGFPTGDEGGHACPGDVRPLRRHAGHLRLQQRLDQRTGSIRPTSAATPAAR